MKDNNLAKPTRAPSIEISSKWKQMHTTVVQVSKPLNPTRSIRDLNPIRLAERIIAV